MRRILIAVIYLLLARNNTYGNQGVFIIGEEETNRHEIGPHLQSSIRTNRENRDTTNTQEIVLKYHRNNNNTNPKLSRNKRDINDTETSASNERFQEIEMPKAEPWIWPGPAYRRYPFQTVNRPNLREDIIGQQIRNYHEKPLSLDLDLRTSSSHNSRFQPDPDIDDLLFDQKLKQDKISTVNYKAFLPNSNEISRQYPLTDLQSRYPDIPARPQSNYYMPFPLPSLGEAGASLLSLLNPLNLFRSLAPTQPPISNNNLHYNTKQMPTTTNKLPYNNNHLRHITNPSQSPAHEIRQPTWSQEGQSQTTDPIIKEGKIRYEIIKESNQHEHGHEFMKDSSLRDDLYVGKDGNLYIKSDDFIRNSDSKFQDSSYHSGEVDPLPIQTENIKTLNVRYKEPNREDPEIQEELYRELLKNHNMNEDDPNIFGTHYKVIHSGHADTYDLDSWDIYDSDHGFPKPAVNGLHADSLDRGKQSPSHVNYPSYSYATRPVVMPSNYRSRFRNPIPPRTAGPSTTNHRLSGHNPLSSLIFPPYVSRPQSQGYAVGDNNNIHLHQLRKASSHEDSSDVWTSSYTTTENRRTNAHGFYPGNGFFDADFPTVFHMAPFAQRMTDLSSALKENVTLLINKNNSTDNSSSIQ